MTRVGPRPERPEHTGMLEAQLPGFSVRTLVKPGLTGWAQVRYNYAGTVEETRRKLEYDLYYVRRASLGLDLRILMITVLVVLTLQGH
jgi:lipopolysaccharide/colanic/teichoic acid biosynthesis glycosyltransferase